MSAAVWLGFVAAGGLGAVARYLSDRLVSRRVGGVFPWGTFAINASGSLLLGLLVGLGIHQRLPATATTILGTGFCGAYTTFSTFSFETISLIADGAVTQAAYNVGATLVVCAAAAALGLALSAL